MCEEKQLKLYTTMKIIDNLNQLRKPTKVRHPKIVFSKSKISSFAVGNTLREILAGREKGFYQVTLTPRPCLKVSLAFMVNFHEVNSKCILPRIRYTHKRGVRHGILKHCLLILFPLLRTKAIIKYD